MAEPVDALDFNIALRPTIMSLFNYPDYDAVDYREPIQQDRTAFNLPRELLSQFLSPVSDVLLPRYTDAIVPR